MEKPRFELKKNNDGDIIGAGLSGNGDVESKIYCTSFVKALSQGKADIRFEGNTIIFDHKGYECPESCAFERPADEIETLKRILVPNGKLKADVSAAWTGSFILFIEQ